MIMYLEGEFDSPKVIFEDDVNMLISIFNRLGITKEVVYLAFLDKLLDESGSAALYKRFIYDTDMSAVYSTLGIIFVDAGVSFSRLTGILIDEYTHHITQQDHGFLLYELFYDWVNKRIRTEVK